MKYQFNIGEKVRIDEDVPRLHDDPIADPLGEIVDHNGEVGFITDRHPYPKGCEPPYDVDFGNGEIQSYYAYEFDRISP